MCGVTVRRDGLGDPLADGGVRLLRLLGRGGHARADGPHGLVRDHHLGGVEEALDLLELLDALGSDGADALLADGEGLADAEDDLEALLERVRALGREQRVRLGRRRQAKLAATLGVAEQDPLDAHVDHLVGGHLAGVGAAAGKVHVLRCDLGALGEVDHRHVERRRAHVHVALGGVARLNVFHELGQLGRRGRVALPVAADDWAHKRRRERMSDHARSTRAPSRGKKVGGSLVVRDYSGDET